MLPITSPGGRSRRLVDIPEYASALNFEATVDSISYGVLPDDGGVVLEGLPRGPLTIRCCGFCWPMRCSFPRLPDAGGQDRRRGGDGPLHRFSDIAVGECIRSHDSALGYLLSLMQELSGEQDLMLTLETFFANMQRRKVTAAALGVHPNTLDHRLERIENILGVRLDHAAWIAKLEIALKLQGAGERSR
ncbi:PucR family transcriptional regulator [Burkholderia ubonensis]|uniref:PucR family transcriptional regulator n=1 Tax=Burkholderia ubonensis TaxID=101571 RepID=UPI0027380279|nr:helix-turn-helix domain-containing protein [Burkholderia ubonensis]